MADFKDIADKKLINFSLKGSGLGDHESIIER